MSTAGQGLLGWIATVDHKRIGILYMATTLVFFAVGGAEALLIRLQLALPGGQVLSPTAYNQVFTMHGTTMIFLVVMPALFGMANYLVPLMIGAGDMAFPRLNALSYWLFPFGGLLLHFSFLAGGAPDAGWFAYAPLSETPYSSSPGMTYWAIALLLLGIGTVASSLNLVATILALRAPGMTLKRVPLFVWMVLVNSLLALAALPVLNAALVMLLADRMLDAHVFLPSGGGSALLWQHLFWAFGHPEVYIMVLPAFGMISEVIPVFARKPIFGYAFVAASTVAIALLSFGVWAHHMFAVGMGYTADLVFSAGSMLIAVPTGVKIFNWIATLWGGSIRLTTAMLFAVAFLIEFVIGGLSGVTFAVVPFDWQVTDTYYLVAHFHYVLFGGTFFALCAGLHYWFPKMSGRMPSERAGKWSFWLMVIGFNMTFFVQHFLGLMGMPRRVYTYPDLPGWGALNLVSTAGALILGLAIAVMVVNLLWTIRHGAPAGDNPWDAWTLEWASFETLPPIRGRRPLWDVAHPESPDEVADGPERAFDPTRVGVTSFCFSEVAFFVCLLVSYLVATVGPQGAVAPRAALDVAVATAYTACLLASSFTLWRSERALRVAATLRARVWLVLTLLLGSVFLFGQAREYVGLLGRGITPDVNLFATAFFTVTGFHGLHVLAGLVLLAVFLGLTFVRGFSNLAQRLAAAGIYWHFVDAVWVAVFAVVYLRTLR
jgi:cytochrome c oxidase subunit I